MYEYEQEIKTKKSALNDLAITYVLEGIPGLKPPEFFSRVYASLINIMKENRNTKVNLVLICIMERILKRTEKGIQELEEYKVYFRSKTYKNYETSNEEEILSKCINKIVNDIEDFTSNGSGWWFKEIKELNINTIKFNPTKGTSYIDLPSWIKDKKAIINLQNKDDKCFLWCILRYLHPKELHAERIKDLEKYEFSLNTKEITFPMKLNDITKFEKLNPELPGINVFSTDEKTIYPLREANRDCKNSIDLFLYEEDGVSHYTLIKNFQRLIKSQKTSHKGEMFICKRCFSHYTKEELLEKHIKYCSKNQTALITMPKPNTFLYFKNYYKKLPVPFVVYADFECFTKPMNSCSPKRVSVTLILMTIQGLKGNE